MMMFNETNGLFADEVTLVYVTVPGTMVSTSGIA